MGIGSLTPAIASSSFHSKTRRSSPPLDHKYTSSGGLIRNFQDCDSLSFRKFSSNLSCYIIDFHKSTPSLFTTIAFVQILLYSI